MEKYKKELKRYVSDMEAKGYSIESITQQLQNHGHAKEVVEETVKEMRTPQRKGDAVEKRTSKKSFMPEDLFTRKKLLRGKERFFIAMYFLGFLALIAWISHSSGASFGKVFLCFSPAMLTLIAVVVILETQMQALRAVNWVIPVIMSVMFYVVAAPNNQSFLKDIDATNLTVANFIVSILFVVFLEALIQMTLREPAEKKREEVTHHRKTSRSLDTMQVAGTHVEMSRKKQIEEYIQSIEDKCKALNFVIGRVYSNKHGGSPELRDMIKVPSEWYNEFSKVTEENFDENIVVVKKMMWSIYDRLLLLKKKESEVFTSTQLEKIKGLIRKGDDQIIKILVHNDNDPVETYYGSAIEFCQKATQELEGPRT